MALPTTTDILIANVMAERIIMKDMFLELKEKTIYFRDVELIDVPWTDRLTVSQLIDNIPPKFLAKYPFDFKIRFTTLGCNKLKCYKHNYNEPCKGKTPTIINNEFFKCQPACYKVFEDFNKFLLEKYQLPDKRPKNPSMELPFETTSISAENDDTCYCGTQLTNLKRFAILPSARWADFAAGSDADKILDASSAGPYLLKKYKDQPVQRRRLAGLVDSPPLNWNTRDQTINFNQSYCKRFVKEYDPIADECYTIVERKVAGFLLGDTFIRQFPELRDLSLENYPFRYLDETVNGLDGISRVNNGYVERPINEDAIILSDTPDKTVSKMEIVNDSSFFKTSARAWLFRDENDRNGMGSILLDMARDIAIENSVEKFFETAPKLIAKLLEKKVAPKIIKNTVALSWVKIHTVTKIVSLLIRTQLTNLTIKLSVRILAAASNAASIVFAVGIVTAIADIFLTIYNVGGFNNEITREMVDEKKREIINQTVDCVLRDWGRLYVPIIRDPNDEYASPFINPEFLYNVCIINFSKMYPNELDSIGNMGISEINVQNVALEYLSYLTVNSAGQTIAEYRENDVDSNNQEIETTLSFIDEYDEKENNNNNTNVFLWKDTDLYLLKIGVICWILSLIIFLFLKIQSKTLVVCGTVCFIAWFIFISLSLDVI